MNNLKYTISSFIGTDFDKDFLRFAYQEVDVNPGNPSYPDGNPTIVDDLYLMTYQSLLQSVTIRGEQDGVLKTISFDYTYDQNSQRNLLTTVRNGEGGTTRITYDDDFFYNSNKDLVYYWNGQLAFSYTYNTVALVVNPVKRVTSDDGLGQIQNVWHEYRYPFYDPGSNEFRGYQTVQVDNALNAAVYWFDGSEFYKPMSEYIYETAIGYPASDSPYIVSELPIDKDNPGDSAYKNDTSPKLVSATIFGWDLAGRLWSKTDFSWGATWSATDPQVGVATSVQYLRNQIDDVYQAVNYGRVLGDGWINCHDCDFGGSATTQKDDTTLSVDYIEDKNKWIFVPKSESLAGYDSSGKAIQIAAERYFYDGQNVLGQLDKGLLTRIDRWDGTYNN